MNHTETTGVNRRSVIKTAAWAAPVVAVAVAAPTAVASTGNVTSVSFTDPSTSLLPLHILDSATIVTAQALVTVPTKLTIVNGPGAISADNAQVTIVVGRPSGINLTLGPARGFGVYSLDGTVTPSGSRSVDYNSVAFLGDIGFPITTYTGTHSVSVASNGTLDMPVVWGLTGSSGISVSALATFPISGTITFSDGSSYPLTGGSISVPVGAGIL